jgi:hypothetical protein
LITAAIFQSVLLSIFIASARAVQAVAEGEEVDSSDLVSDVLCQPLLFFLLF